MTDRERLLELADAVIHAYIMRRSPKNSREWHRIVKLSARVLIAPNTRTAEGVFKELDRESQEWDNEGGQ